MDITEKVTLDNPAPYTQPELTPHYGLPIYADQTVTNWQQFNNGFEAIDGAIWDNKGQIALNGEDITRVQADIASANTEISNVSDRVTQVSSDLATETRNLSDSIANVQSTLNGEITATNTTVTQHTQTLTLHTTHLNEIDEEIETLNGESAVNEANISKEVNDRKSADNSLQLQINSNLTEINSVQTDVDDLTITVNNINLDLAQGSDYNKILTKARSTAQGLLVNSIKISNTPINPIFVNGSYGNTTMDSQWISFQPNAGSFTYYTDAWGRFTGSISLPAITVNAPGPYSIDVGKSMYMTLNITLDSEFIIPFKSAGNNELCVIAHGIVFSSNTSQNTFYGVGSYRIFVNENVVSVYCRIPCTASDWGDTCTLTFSPTTIIGGCTKILEI